MTCGDRRRVSVVLLGRAEPAPDEAVLRQAIGRYGGRLAPRSDGTTAVVLESDQQMASDQAAQTARLALVLAATGRPIALAMGTVSSASNLPEQDVIERASRLLARADGDAPAIALDEVIAGLLDARFDVVERDAGLVLRSERVLMQGARTLLGRPTALVGRDWELGALTANLDQCIDERRAHAVVVIAAAGMGKSRLAAELVS